MTTALKATENPWAVERLKADVCIKNHVIAAMGVALVPSFFIELTGVSGIEVSMIVALARIYDFPIPNRLIAYKVLLSLVLSLGPIYLATRLNSATKLLPLAGHAAYYGTLSFTNAAAVYAVGKVFQLHFESGGQFLSQNNSVLRSIFKQHMDEGRQQIPALMAEAGTAKPTAA